MNGKQLEANPTGRLDPYSERVWRGGGEFRKGVMKGRLIRRTRKAVQAEANWATDTTSHPEKKKIIKNMRNSVATCCAG